MSEKFKNSKFYKAMKNPKVSRAIYIAMVILLVAVAVVIGITAATNRTKKPSPTPSTSSPSNTQAPAPGTSSAPDTSTQPEDTQAAPESTAPGAPVVKPVPTLSLPVSGSIAKKHDAEIQVFSNTMNDYRVHLGIDIATAAGAPVYAAADGKVTKMWRDPMMGYCIAIEHDGDAVTVYKNLAEEAAEGIEAGATVKAGKQIGKVGDSAMLEAADEPHLHLEMTVGGLQVNPLDYFSVKDVAALDKDENYES